MKTNPNAPNSVFINKERKSLFEYIRTDFPQIIQLFSQFSAFRINQLVGRVVASLMMADIVFQMKKLNNKSYKFSCGYDRYQLMNAHGFIIGESRLPEINKSFNQSIGIRIPSNSNILDIMSLGEIIGVNNSFPIIAGFFPISNNTGFILMSPYSKLDWDDSDLDFFVYCINALYAVFSRIQDYYLLNGGENFPRNEIFSKSNHVFPEDILKLITRIEISLILNQQKII